VDAPPHDTDAQPFTEHDFRFTVKKEALYAFQLGWPKNGEGVIHSVAGAQVEGQKIASVSLLGSSSTLPFQLQPDGLHIHLPAQPPGKYAHAFKITFESSRR
jgi:alpha-L-fucosidase